MAIRSALFSALLLFCWACSSAPASPAYTFSDTQDAAVREVMAKHKIATAAIGVIRGGELVFTKYYGEAAPGVAVTQAHLFNTASAHKAITAETMIALANKGLLDLDEPISGFYEHPDIAGDPRNAKLTPRILLGHRGGFRNWPYEYEDEKLAYDFEPGEGYNYSGIGLMILARAVEAKLGKPYPQIVQEQVFDPAGMTHTACLQSDALRELIVTPVDETGAFLTDYALDPGYWNPSDDLFTTVEDMAKFLIWVRKSEGLSEDLKAQRIAVQSDLTGNEIWGCDGVVDPCPAPFGHGLAWFVFGYDGNISIQHGGNDISEGSSPYIDLGSGDGAVVFVNGPTPTIALYRIVEIVDEDQQFTKVFNHIIDKYLSGEGE